jgi:diketogulonate reductase-like aldo/keto reductase
MAHNSSIARIALAWLLTKPFVTSIVLGAKRLDQLQDNLSVLDIKLSQEEIKMLEEVSELPPEYPGGCSRLKASIVSEPKPMRFGTSSTARWCRRWGS